MATHQTPQALFRKIRIAVAPTITSSAMMTDNGNSGTVGEGVGLAFAEGLEDSEGKDLTVGNALRLGAKVVDRVGDCVRVGFEVDGADDEVVVVGFKVGDRVGVEVGFEMGVGVEVGVSKDVGFALSCLSGAKVCSVN